MLPPGLAFLSFSEFAWDAYSHSKMPKYYFDVEQYRHYYELVQPPYTPALSVMFALDHALKIIMSEGVDKLLERHSSIAKITRAGIKELGLSLFPNENVASDTVTAVSIPDSVDGARLLSIVREEHGVILASGQGQHKDKLFRIGHMGQVAPEEIYNVLTAVKSALTKVGFYSSASTP